MGNTRKIHEGICVVFYTRNTATLEVKKIVIQANVEEKNHGVKSGIIIEPEELAGFICAPTDITKATWIVARPFENRSEYGNPSALKEQIPPPANKFALYCQRLYPKVHPGAFSKTRGKYRKFGQSPQGILDVIETDKLLERIEGAKLASTTNGHPDNHKLIIKIDENQPETKGKTKIPTPGDKVILISNSPYTWPRIKSPQLSESFSNIYMDGSEYLEFTFAVVECEKDELIVKPLVPLSHPESASCFIYRPGEETIALTTQNIANSTQSVLL